jgi:hypothetical protein
MRLEARLVENDLLHGSFITEVVHAVLRDEWGTARS